MALGFPNHFLLVSVLFSSSMRACEWTCNVAQSVYVDSCTSSQLRSYMNICECMHLGRCVWPFCEGWNEGTWLVWSFTFCRYVSSSGLVFVRASGLVMSRAVSICG